MSFMLAYSLVAAFTQANAMHEFKLANDGSAKKAFVAGSFNSWSPTATPMKLSTNGKYWTASVPLEFGKHTYKFVLDGARWITDPGTDKMELDGSGNKNSLLIVVPPDFGSVASPADGVFARSALFHENSIPYLSLEKGRGTFQFRSRKNDLKAVEVRVGGKRFRLEKVYENDLYSFSRVEVPLNLNVPLRYQFILKDGTKEFTFGPNGLGSGPTNSFSLQSPQRAAFNVPSWVEGSVLYQIFPDRFENGLTANDPSNLSSWDSKPTYFSQHGGDIAGVQSRIGHLKSLGVNGVYFNPIFKSPSNHRYDAQDFKSIDPSFGTTSEFVALSKSLQSSGIRTILDFVFNHTATTFPQFEDLVVNGEKSKYRDWFFPKSFPIKVQQNPNYEAWNNFSSMPKLNVLNPATSDYLLNLVDYWNEKLPMAGMRLDVAGEVDSKFWRKLRSRAKGLNANMWLLGEVWGDGSPWLKGDQWDSVMNYPFRYSAISFFAKQQTKPSEYMSELMRVYCSYAPQVSRNLMNLLSSHDTPRFLTDANNDQEMAKLAALMQFTWVGVPSIYYGEELGMSGGADPDNRQGMKWGLATPDNQFLNFYQKLIRIRSQNPVLQSGRPVPLSTDDRSQTFAFARVLGQDHIVVAVNRSNQTQRIIVSLPGMENENTYSDLLGNVRSETNSKRQLTFLIPAKSGAILRPAGKIQSRRLKVSGPSLSSTLSSALLPLGKL